MRQETLKRYLLGIGIAAAVVGVDLFTKRLASIEFVGGSRSIIPGLLWFTFGENPGAAFSMFRNAGPFLGIAQLAAVGIVLWSFRTERPTVEVAGLALVMGGAAGNVTDRIFRGPGALDGHVIDWIQFPNFPIFNVADSAITIGVALMMIAAWLQRPRVASA